MAGVLAEALLELCVEARGFGELVFKEHRPAPGAVDCRGGAQGVPLAAPDGLAVVEASRPSAHPTRRAPPSG